MRIPSDVVRDGLGAINQAAEQMAAAQLQVSTGRRLLRAGDDPLGSQQAVLEHAGLGAIDAYSRSRDGAAARLAAADSVLASFGDKLASAIAMALGARGSSTTPAARAAAADAIRGLRDSLLSDMNTTFNGVSLFAGTRAAGAAYALVAGSWTYQGTGQTSQVEVERGRLVSVTFDGQAIAQGSDPVDIFTVLDNLAAAITAGNDAAIGTEVTGVERALDRTLLAQGRLGADERGLDDATVRLAALKSSGETRRSKIEDVNMAEAVMRLTEAETAYRAALGSVSVVERVSLLDYLK